MKQITKTTPELREQIEKEYEAGATQASLCKKYKLSSAYMCYIAKYGKDAGPMSRKLKAARRPMPPLAQKTEAPRPVATSQVINEVRILAAMMETIPRLSRPAREYLAAQLAELAQSDK